MFLVKFLILVLWYLVRDTIHSCIESKRLFTFAISHALTSEKWSTQMSTGDWWQTQYAIPASSTWQLLFFLWVLLLLLKISIIRKLNDNSYCSHFLYFNFILWKPAYIPDWNLLVDPVSHIQYSEKDLMFLKSLPSKGLLSHLLSPPHGLHQIGLPLRYVFFTSTPMLYISFWVVMFHFINTFLHFWLLCWLLFFLQIPSQGL